MNNNRNENNNNNNNNNKPVKGEATRLSRFQIAAFFFIGYFLLPLSPLWCVLSAFYQLCLVQGTLSSQARVITAVVCVFFLVALIPFVNVALYFTYSPELQNDISVRINGQVPLGILTIFYLWGSVIGYRYYTIPASYEQERDRDSIRRLEQQELRPPLLVTRSIAEAARGIDGKYSHSVGPGGGDTDDNNSISNSVTSINAAIANNHGSSPYSTSVQEVFSGSPTTKQQAPINIMMTAEYQAGNYDTFAQFTAKNFELSPTASTGTANTVSNYSPRGSALNTGRRSTFYGGSSPFSGRMNASSASAVNDDDDNNIPDSAADMQSSQNPNNSATVAQLQQQYAAWLQQQQYAAFLSDKVVVRNAYDLYCLLKEETGQGAGATMLIGLLLATATIATARIQEWQSKIHKPLDPRFNTTLYDHEPVYSLSTIFFAGIFFVFYTTLAFVKHLYSQNIQLVYHLTFLGRGVGDLRADKEIFSTEAGASGIDDDDSDSEDNKESDGERSNQSMHYISATAFSTYESTVPDNGNATPTQNRGGFNAEAFLSAPAGSNYNKYQDGDQQQQQQQQNNNNNTTKGISTFSTTSTQKRNGNNSANKQQKVLSAKAAKAVVVELLDPYNMTHLRAWEEVRKIAAEQIASPTSVLNSFFTPTVFISAFGGFGLALYISVRVLFMQRVDDVGGPFFTAATALSIIFLIYLILVYISARETRGHFKSHETIVSRIAFDVARELEHSVRRSQLGLEYLTDDNNNNNNNTNDNSNSNQLFDDQHNASGTIVNFNNNPSNNNNNPSSPANFVGLNPQQMNLITQGKAHFFHEPPTTESELTSLFDSVNSLCNMMSVATPRPLFVGMEQRNVRYFLAYVLATCAILLFFALLTSMRNGYCKDNVKEEPTTMMPSSTTGANTTTASSSSGAPGMLWVGF